jgi:hypothetical protein
LPESSNKIKDLHSILKSENAKIWRYVSFSKYISLLDQMALHLTRLDKLNEKFEGSLPMPDIENRPEELHKLFGDHLDLDINKYEEWIQKSNIEMRKFIYVSCWHLNESESEAMWDGKKKEIAIQSNIKNFISSLRPEPKEMLYVGKIKYIDYRIDKLNDGNFLEKYFHKKNIFINEKEIRLLSLRFTEDLPKGKNLRIFVDKPAFEYGFYLPVDLNVLIEKIHVSPKTRKWLFELIKSVTTKYGFKFDIQPSTLDFEPVF